MKAMKILVRVPNWLGDAVLAIPAIKDLHYNFSHDQIVIMGQPWAQDLYSPLGFISEFVSLGKINHLRDFFSFAQNLHQQQFELGLLLTNSFSSAFLFSLARIPQRWGYSQDGRRLLLTRAPSPPAGPVHQVEYYRQLLLALECRLSSDDSEVFSLPLPEDPRQRDALAEAFQLDKKKPWIIFHPGAAYGPAKRWPARHFAQLAELLAQKNAEIVLVGTQKEFALGAQISSLAPFPLKNLCGRTSLPQLIKLIQQAHLVVANDSGPLHLANLVRTPVVALFGPTDPRQTGPFRPPAQVLKKPAPCWPCWYRTCPFDHRCLTSITPEEVLASAEKFLN
ncbi:MAG TPA: lipopolysaccharide heptosyltransferase II [Candidatus Aminicenantes bacterium]|nr:lipopolysaccharide heptosyltransferase II [Candidatus Aminicenantes bacterium]